MLQYSHHIISSTEAILKINVYKKSWYTSHVSGFDIVQAATTHSLPLRCLTFGRSPSTRRTHIPTRTALMHLPCEMTSSPRRLSVLHDWLQLDNVEESWW